MSFKYSPLLNEVQERKLDKLTQRVAKDKMIVLYQDLYRFNNVLLHSLKREQLTGWEMKSFMPHPLLFELGHVVYFFEYHILRHTRKENHNVSLLERSNEMFDSLINRPQERKDSYMVNYRKQLEYYTKVHKELITFLEEYEDTLLSPFHSYIFMIGYLHNIMHQEVFLFLQHQLGVKCPFETDWSFVKYQKTTNKTPTIYLYNSWVSIPSGTFSLGLEQKDRIVVWDNEMPKHTVKIKEFICQRQPTLNHEYQEFVFAGGYNEKKYWSYRGWKWRVEKLKKEHPYFWCKRENKWYRLHFDVMKPLEPNEPVVHVSYYEAEAYANYRNSRLPTEKEYVYLLTNGGKTEYPWGNDRNLCSLYSNMNFTYNDVVPVDIYNGMQQNEWGVDNLLGNCWYWTSTPFYPYDNFKIDPCYDTFSYPFFYFRMIVKGSSWASNDELVHSNYRNAQEKESFHHFTGIRLVCDIKEP